MQLCVDVVPFLVALVHHQLELDLDYREVADVVVELVVGHVAKPATGRLEHKRALLGEDERALGVVLLTLRLHAGGKEAAVVQEAVDHQPDILGEEHLVHLLN